MVRTKMPRLTSPKRKKKSTRAKKKSVSPVLQRLARYTFTHKLYIPAAYKFPSPPKSTPPPLPPKRRRSPHKKTSSTPRKRRRSPNKSHKFKKRN